MRFLIALYALEGAVFLTALALHRYYNLLSVLTIRQSLVILVPLAASLVSGVYVVGCWTRSRSSGAKQFAFTAIMNLVALAILLVAGEVMVRVFTVRTHSGSSFAGTVLLPKSWEDVRARNAELLEKARPDISYFMSDPLLGWTLGPSRRSTDGLYMTSAEGIRSPRQGMAYAEHAAERRIAIVGDSFTFGLEVPFEDSWGSQL
ncbi:MAG: hypothetical protein ACRD2A_19585, partial [Vicinamibacterales bacterium]